MAQSKLLSGSIFFLTCLFLPLLHSNRRLLPLRLLR
jgi:hypothetical protein